MTTNEAPKAKEPPIEIPQHAYEAMCRALYAYRFGTISFLELLDKFEEVLNIRPPPATSLKHLSEKE
jgi:hypothetical protein